MDNVGGDKESLLRVLATILVVGVLWGCTNTLIRRGAVRAQLKLAAGASKGWFSSVLVHITTPAFIIPQVR
jgi:hypothetical protein